VSGLPLASVNAPLKFTNVGTAELCTCPAELGAKHIVANANATINFTIVRTRKDFTKSRNEDAGFVEFIFECSMAAFCR
jgi:hypothetical protein